MCRTVAMRVISAIEVTVATARKQALFGDHSEGRGCANSIRQPSLPKPPEHALTIHQSESGATTKVGRRTQTRRQTRDRFECAHKPDRLATLTAGMDATKLIFAAPA